MYTLWHDVYKLNLRKQIVDFIKFSMEKSSYVN